MIMATDDELGLANVIRALRAELEESITAGSAAKVRFKPGDVQVELKVSVEKKADGKAGVRFKVLSFVDIDVGGGGSYAHEAVQTIRMSLSPIVIGQDGRPSDDQLISSDEREVTRR
jgi:hypothetical protein